MNDVATLSPRRGLHQALQPQPGAAISPHTVKFLDYHSQLEARVGDLEELVKRSDVDQQVATQRIQFLEAELRREQVRRSAYERGYLSMKLQISLVANTAIGALEESKREFHRDGIDTDTQHSDRKDAIDDSAAKIGSTFGAGFGDAGDRTG